MGPIEQQAIHILNKPWAEAMEQPASLSGKYHKGETMREHLTAAAYVMGLLCEGHRISKEDTDLLKAAAWLHDIGKFAICAKGKVEGQNWRYFDATDWSRIDDLMCIHPMLSSAVLDRYENLPRKEELKRLVSIHMNRFYKRTPKPETLYEYLVCEADFLSYSINPKNFIDKQ